MKEINLASKQLVNVLKYTNTTLWYRINCLNWNAFAKWPWIADSVERASTSHYFFFHQLLSLKGGLWNQSWTTPRSSEELLNILSSLCVCVLYLSSKHGSSHRRPRDGFDWFQGNAFLRDQEFIWLSKSGDSSVLVLQTRSFFT